MLTKRPNCKGFNRAFFLREYRVRSSLAQKGVFTCTYRLVEQLGNCSSPEIRYYLAPRSEKEGDCRSLLGDHQF